MSKHKKWKTKKTGNSFVEINVVRSFCDVFFSVEFCEYTFTNTMLGDTVMGDQRCTIENHLECFFNCCFGSQLRDHRQGSADFDT